MKVQEKPRGFNVIQNYENTQSVQELEIFWLQDVIKQNVESALDYPVPKALAEQGI